MWILWRPSGEHSQIGLRVQPRTVFLPFVYRIADNCSIQLVKFLQPLLPGLVWAIVICLTGCATPRRLVIDPAPSARTGDSPALPAIYDPHPASVLQGNASFYGKPQPTASGERFDPKALTAAHKTLPLHSVVRVVNLKNNQSVIVRINDRGPYVRGRIIDLSSAAAEKVSMINSGVVPVRVEVLRRIDIMQKPNRKVVGHSGSSTIQHLKTSHISQQPKESKPAPPSKIKHRRKHRKHHSS